MCRLQAYDRNFNFGHNGSLASDSDYKMTLPDAATFKDINTDSKIPDVTEAEVDNYLSLYDQTLRKKITDMYNGRFLRTIRSSHMDTMTFVKGRVSAEMSKSCVYIVDISLDIHGGVHSGYRA